jgi:pimeloyl-ACP methyl ester carboxylesterase
MDARNTSSAQHAAKVIAIGRNANEIAKPIAKIVGSAVFSPSLVAGLGQVDPIAAEQDKEPAGWVNALIDHLSLERFVIVGQDWGGPIGLSIAANRADDVAGLVIGNSFMWPPEAMMMRIFAAVMGGRIGKYLILRHNFFTRRLMPAILNRPESKTAEIRKAYTDPFPTPESRMGTYIFPWALNNSGE